ncbi:hypothetical protein [Allokutzneria albata]|uniref:Uncharacterized protein n=1 Tax=Allokutzneria albata TaxID=211114 RepID=A0A1G9SFH1_ALLAB|nr:hypothetical protein [Allokutzneria albata]SDM34151.1 hypothetical protein SAMN04489726_1131 [Allokutzneria albata]
MDVRDWAENVHIMIDQLGDQLAGEADLDFSLRSLAELEAAVLGRVDDAEEPADPDVWSLAEFAAAYSVRSCCTSPAAAGP